MAVAYPVTSTIYGTNWAGTISGTSSTSSGSAVASASVSVKDTTANKWCGWHVVRGGQLNLRAGDLGTTSWSLTFGAGHLTSGDSYSVTGQATDSAGNSGTSSPATAFTYNTTAPSVGVSYPVNSTLYGTTLGRCDHGHVELELGLRSRECERRAGGHHRRKVVERHLLHAHPPDLCARHLRHHQLVVDLCGHQPHLGTRLQCHWPGH